MRSGCRRHRSAPSPSRRRHSTLNALEAGLVSSFSDRCSAIAAICRSARKPVAITMRSQNAALLPARSKCHDVFRLVVFQAADDDLLPSLSNVDVSDLRARRGTAGRGPAQAIVFLRGVPGVLPASGGCRLGDLRPLRGAARWRAGENGFGGLAMTLLLCWHGSHLPMRRAAARTEKPRLAQRCRQVSPPIAPAVLHARADAPHGPPMRDDCSRVAAKPRRKCGVQIQASDANAAVVAECRLPSARRSAREGTAAAVGAACRWCSACRTLPRSRWR